MKAVQMGILWTDYFPSARVSLGMRVSPFEFSPQFGGFESDAAGDCVLEDAESVLEMVVFDCTCRSQLLDTMSEVVYTKQSSILHCASLRLGFLQAACRHLPISR